MKRQFIFLILCVVISLSGCGNTENPASSDGNVVISQAIELISRANSIGYTLVIEDSITYGKIAVESYTKMDYMQIFEPFTVWAKTDSKTTRINGEKERTVYEIYQEAYNDQLDLNMRYGHQEDLNLDQDPVLSDWEGNTIKAKEDVDFTIKMKRSYFEGQLYLLSSNINSFQLVEDDTGKDKNILHYNGYIDPATVLEAYQKYVRDYYVQMNLLVDSEDPSLEDLKIEIMSGEVPDLQTGFPKLAYSEESIPISLWINEDTLVLEKVVIDETLVLQSLLEIETPKVNPDLEPVVVSKSLNTYEITGIDTLKQIIMPEEVNVYSGETEINVDGRSFELEDIPENMAEEVVINDFKYSIVGDFDSLSKILADTEPHNISLKNEEEQFNEGNYIQSYTIHEVSTLTINEYNQQKLENGKYNPLYFYGWEEIVEKYNLKEYEIINVKFTQKHSDKSIELGPQWGDGTYNRNFIVGKSSKDNNYKIYEYGGMLNCT